MSDDNTTEQQKKKRKSKRITSYSNMTQAQADERLGIRIELIISDAIPVDEMLANSEYRLEDGLDASIKETKEKVYEHIVEYLDVTGYPTGATADFKEANINYLVYATTSANYYLWTFIRRTGCKSMKLRFEKEIVSVDGEEFVLVDLVSVTEEKFVFIVEAKKASLGLAMRQCLLSMKDMRDSNGGLGGEVYGFVTTGKQWQMVRYDGTTFITTEEFAVLFHTMGTNKKRWMKDYSVMVDCMYAALSNGGIVQND